MLAGYDLVVCDGCGKTVPEDTGFCVLCGQVFHVEAMVASVVVEDEEYEGCLV